MIVKKVVFIWEIIDAAQGEQESDKYIDGIPQKLEIEIKEEHENAGDELIKGDTSKIFIIGTSLAEFRGRFTLKISRVSQGENPITIEEKKMSSEQSNV